MFTGEPFEPDIFIPDSEAKALSDPETGEMTIEVRELPPGAKGAWARQGGWPAWCSRFRPLCRLLGGEARLESFRDADGEERHQATFEGPKLEGL